MKTRIGLMGLMGLMVVTGPARGQLYEKTATGESIFG